MIGEQLERAVRSGELVRVTLSFPPGATPVGYRATVEFYDPSTGLVTLRFPGGAESNFNEWDITGVEDAGRRSLHAR